MAKDPAFLFYYQDFLVGTDEFSNEEVGAYIRCLCFQAAKNGITDNHMKNICKTQAIQNAIKKKFIFFPDEGVYKNERLVVETEKRKKYSESRSGNRLGRKKGVGKPHNISSSYEPHMENENENKDENENELDKKDGVEGREDLKNGVENKLLVPQMLQLWIASFPTYTQDRELDYPALRNIAGFIFKNSGNANGFGKPDLEIKALNTFQLIADQVGKEPFWTNKSLSSIAKNIQEFYNKIKNPIDGKEKSTNGARTAGINEATLKQKLADKIAARRQANHQ